MTLSEGTNLAQTEKASVSLKEHVVIPTPFSGQYPLKVIQRLSRPRISPSSSALYVTGDEEFFSFLLTGSQSENL